MLCYFGFFPPSLGNGNESQFQFIYFFSFFSSGKACPIFLFIHLFSSKVRTCKILFLLNFFFIMIELPRFTDHIFILPSSYIRIIVFYSSYHSLSLICSLDKSQISTRRKFSVPPKNIQEKIILFFVYRAFQIAELIFQLIYILKQNRCILLLHINTTASDTFFFFAPIQCWKKKHHRAPASINPQKRQSQLRFPDVMSPLQ